MKVGATGPSQRGVPLYGALGVERISLTAHLQRGPYHVDRGKAMFLKRPFSVRFGKHRKIVAVRHEAVFQKALQYQNT